MCGGSLDRSSDRGFSDGSLFSILPASSPLTVIRMDTFCALSLFKFKTGLVS